MSDGLDLQVHGHGSDFGYNYGDSLGYHGDYNVREDVDLHNDFSNVDLHGVAVHHVYHHEHHHGHAMEPNFNFHYPTYEIPVHGDVVSEKDAKKIG